MKDKCPKEAPWKAKKRDGKGGGKDSLPKPLMGDMGGKAMPPKLKEAMKKRKKK